MMMIVLINCRPHAAAAASSSSGDDYVLAVTRTRPRDDLVVTRNVNAGTLTHAHTHVQEQWLGFVLVRLLPIWSHTWNRFPTTQHQISGWHYITLTECEKGRESWRELRASSSSEDTIISLIFGYTNKHHFREGFAIPCTYFRPTLHLFSTHAQNPA